MHRAQLSQWDLNSVRAQPESSENNEQREAKRKVNKSARSQWYFCCSNPILTGLLIGALTSGIALAALLMLRLHKGSSNSTCSTVTSGTLSTMSSVSVTTISSATSVNTTSALNVNLLANGDAETSPCASDHTVSSPVGWNFSGPISQCFYNSSIDQSLSSPGPSDRGQCYFYGQASASTSMWQTINLNNKVDPVLIDNQTIQFNLSAWLGGITNQDDSGTVSLTFLDSNNQYITPSTNISVDIGPILASDRNNHSSLIFQQKNGFVPVGTRSMLLLVTLNRADGIRNNGDIDNIALYLH